MSMTWTDANRVANIAAAQAHHALHVDPAAPPIDVRGAIAAADVLLMWRPLPRLFGVYINNAGSRPGILVNSEIPRSARRHTAAHELGHHRFGHRVAVDDGRTVELDLPGGVSPVRGPQGWTDHEKTAEAFASWFLMPRKAVVAAMRLLGIDRPVTADEVYQLSLVLGTSFRSAVRHLPNLRLATRAQAAEWMKAVPGKLKTMADPSGTRRSCPQNDVWRLHSGYNGATIRVAAGDRLVLAGAVPDGSIPGGLIAVPSPEIEPVTVYDCPAVNEDWETTLAFASNGIAPWSVRLRVAARPHGLDLGQG